MTAYVDKVRYCRTMFVRGQVVGGRACLFGDTRCVHPRAAGKRVGEGAKRHGHVDCPVDCVLISSSLLSRAAGRWRRR
jgi:hypothetical protein